MFNDQKRRPKQYIVKKGDTLWDISGVYLDEPWQWPDLWQMNPQIANPHLIYPGDALTLIYDKDGNPRLVKNARYKKLSPEGRITPKAKMQTLPLSCCVHISLMNKRLAPILLLINLYSRC